MTHPLKRRLLAILALLCLISPFLGTPEGAQAQAGAPYEVLAEINGLRIANGMAPLAENQYLNLAAQNHANWIATTLQGGHTGEGGSTPADRALAVGYGGGARVSVTENWARGPGLTAYNCVYTMWAPSSAHISNMLTTWHNEFGAGVALDSQGMTVYVVKFGHVVGSAPPQSTSAPGGPSGTQAPLIQSVVTSTSNPDGSVIHVVQFGQTLWGIAEAYEISMIKLLEQNYLTEDSAIFPDQQLLIIPANLEIEGEGETPTPTPTEEPTPTPTATRTPWPRTEAATPLPTPNEVPNPRSNFLVNIFSGDTLWIGIGLVGVSLLGIVLLFITSSRLR
ncbi:MAG: LysM peptidoglycan-binding domain-containing protein [Brevefilum sp.]|nr:LysM peptidoglycan-binding domain-containing protein [Brevefilum sp.]